MKTYKGFDENLRCDPTGSNPFQYKIGKEYVEENASVCESGFHACENALDVMNYYAPGDSRYCEVEMDGKVSKTHSGDTKISASKIKIGMEIGIKGIIEAGIRFIFDRVEGKSCPNTTTGDLANAATTGNSANAATTGNSAHAATTGDWAHAATTGDRAHAATTGDRAHAATTGNSAHAATTGDWAHAATTGNSAHAATTGDRAHAATTGDLANAATTGGWAHAATTGNRAHAVTTGNKANAAVSGQNAIAASLGIDSAAKGKIGSWLVCTEWKENEDGYWEVAGIVSAKVDGETILPDVWYTAKNGKLEAKKC